MVNFTTDTRGIAEGIGYVLGLGLMTTFVVGIMFQGAAIFQDATDIAYEEQLEFESERVAANLEDVDRAARATEAEREISTVVDLPDQIGGSNYHIEIKDTAEGGVVQIDLVDKNHEIQTEFIAETSVEETRFDGGPVRVIKPVDDSVITIEPIQ